MKNGPKAPHVDSRDPRVHVPAGLPADARIRRPIVSFVVGVVKAAATLSMITLAGACFALGVALATRWLQ